MVRLAERSRTRSFYRSIVWGLAPKNTPSFMLPMDQIQHTKSVCVCVRVFVFVCVRV